MIGPSINPGVTYLSSWSMAARPLSNGGLFKAGLVPAIKREMFRGKELQFTLVANPTQNDLVPTEQFFGITACPATLEATD